MKVTQSTFLKSVAAFTVAALTLTISSCSSGEDTSASSTDTENSSTQAASPPLAPCELPADASAEEEVEGTHTGEDISVAPEIGTGYREA